LRVSRKNSAFQNLAYLASISQAEMGVCTEMHILLRNINSLAHCARLDYIRLGINAVAKNKSNPGWIMNYQPLLPFPAPFSQSHNKCRLLRDQA
jgi:hypothetical protein